MKQRKIFHVGLGKTGSTTLQTVILPFLHDEGIVYNNKRILTRLSKLYYDYKIDPNAKGKLTWAKKKEAETLISIASSENIMGWNPANYEKAVSAAKKYLPADSEIMITLRSPKEWLRSLYLHYVGRTSLCVEPRHFFVNREEMEVYQKFFGETSDTLCISVDDLDYQRIVDTWKESFDKVYVIPMEALWDGSLLTRLEVDHRDAHRDYMIKNSGTIKNKSLSQESVELTIIRNKILSGSLKFPGHSYGTMAHLEEFYKNHLDYSIVATKEEIEYLNKSLSTILNKNEVEHNEYFKILAYYWRTLLRDYEGRLGQLNKFHLPEETYLGMYLDRNIDFYESL